MAQTVLPSPSAVVIDWLEEATKLGNIVLQTERGVTTMQLTMGQWGNCHLRVWGFGATIEFAAMHAVTKARAFGTLLPPHPDDC